jgi:hypothetical protein
MWLEVIRFKDEAFARFRKIRAHAEAHGRCKLLVFRSDRDGEFNSAAFKEYCDEGGVWHFTTAPYSPQQNSVVERRNQTVVEMARCMLKSMYVLAKFWGEAVRAATYVLNRAPTRSLQGLTPYEAWNKRKPSVEHLRTFGCVGHMKRTGPGITKLSDRSTMVVFMGYEEGSKAYHVYDPAAKKLHVTRDIVFEEQQPRTWTASSSTTTAAVSPSSSSIFTVVYTTGCGESVTDDGAISMLRGDQATPAGHEPATPAAPDAEPATPAGT